MTRGSSDYLNAQQRAQIHQWKQSWLWRSELPTWLLMATIYSGWFATLAHWQTLGLWPATGLLILLTSWYLSLQHELIHGHPTRFPRLNQLLARCRWRSGTRTGFIAIRIWRTTATTA